LRNHDVCAFRHELRYGEPNTRNESGRTCLEQALYMAESLITRSICTTHVVEKDESSRMDLTIRQLKALVSIMKCLVADERTGRPEGLFLADMPPPYFMLAALKTVAEDYPDERGNPRDSTDNLAMHRVVAEVLAGPPTARHAKHVRFLANFPEYIRRVIELIGRERFKPDPITAQRFMNMAFVFHEPDLFKIAAATPRLYEKGDLGNWDEILAVLQTSGGDKLRDFFFAILASKLREQVRVEVTDLAHKKVFNIPQRIHVSQRLLEASRDVFGDQVANCATRLRQRFLRPVKTHGPDAMTSHAAVADELAEMSWKDVCTAIRSIG
jgi:hypothetical protein